MPASERPSPDAVAADLTAAMTLLRARLRRESALPNMRWTWSQLTTLDRILTNGPATSASLAEAEHVRPQSMHETVSALRADGLIAGRRDPNDGRRILLAATDAGRELVERIRPLREAWLAAAISAFVSDEELEALITATRVMERLANCELRPGGSDTQFEARQASSHKKSNAAPGRRSTPGSVGPGSAR
jgi:DNA-binding MarR family transcriptional regulator